MKTLAIKTVTQCTLAAAVALVGSTVTANAAGPVDFGVSPGGYHAATTGYGSYSAGRYSTGSCATGDCGHAACAAGDCRMNSDYDRFGNADRYHGTADMAFRSNVSSYRPNAYYGQSSYGQAPRNSAACLGGYYPQTPAVSHTANYQSQIRAGGCVTGDCPTTPASRYQSTRTPMFSFLGMRF